MIPSTLVLIRHLLWCWCFVGAYSSSHSCHVPVLQLQTTRSGSNFSARESLDGLLQLFILLKSWNLCLQPGILFLCSLRCIYLKGRGQGHRARKIDFPSTGSFPQVSATARAGPGWNRELGIPSGFCLHLAETRALGPDIWESSCEAWKPRSWVLANGL